MSRMPPGQGPGPSPTYQHHPHPHHAPQSQMYYPPPPQHGGPPMNYPPPHGDGMYGGGGNVPLPPHRQYDHPRSAPAPPPISNGGQQWSDGYGPPPPGSSGSGSSVPGSSRMTNSQPPMMDPYYAPPSSSSGPPPGPGWSSVHPGSSSKAPSGRPGTRGNARPVPDVKLEDLVSSDSSRGRPPTSGAGFTSVPLPPDGGRPTTAPGPPPSAAGAASAGGDSGGAPAGPSEFIKKLYKMLEEESATYGRGLAPGQPRPEGAKRGSVGWGRGGTTFVVWDMNDFTTKILPQTFRHSNFSSFVRQLNKYGFSKIKHADENTGQIKENVWEFQHPNFQAGGKADLDSIKRKAVVPKKGEDGDGSTGGKGLNQEDATRITEMENRVAGLEDQLALALEEIRLARVRETGLHDLAREMIMHMTQLERASHSPLSDGAPSPQIGRLHVLLNGIAGPPYMSAPAAAPYPPHPHSATGSSGSHTMPGIPPTGPGYHISPGSSGGSRGHEGTSPEGSKTSHQPRQTAGEADDVIELPNHQQTLYNGDPVSMTPTFADMPAWLTENTTTTMPMYHRKSSDGATLRLMLDTLAGQGSGMSSIPTVQVSGPGSGNDTQDPLDTSPRADVKSEPSGPSPFGSIVFPQQDSQSSNANGNGKSQTVIPPPHRRSTTITTSWTHAPKILVVEDDVVYRQLSSKFLEKFGCIIETVEDAQQAIERMNHTKYDLVLMDIFFGPSMDGRKATSLIRQFDMYTPIISMTSNAQPQDVDSYLQSGMNDVLAKPFTKRGLFGILDKHLIHLKAIQMSGEIPRSLGLPPLSDQGVMDAVMNGGGMWDSDTSNPLASMGWSDDTYQLVFQQFLSTGAMPEVSQMTIGNGSIGTNIIFGDNRKRNIELLEDDWTSPITETSGPTPQAQTQAQMPPPPTAETNSRGPAKRMKGGVSAK